MKNIFNRYLLMLLASLFIAVFALSACGGSLDDNPDHAADVSGEPDTHDDTVDEADDEQTPELDGFIKEASVPIEFETLFRSIAIFDYTNEYGYHNRIEWLGEDEIDGVNVDKYDVISEDALGKREFEIWVDDDLQFRYFEDKDGSNNQLAGTDVFIVSIFKPFNEFDSISRGGFASGDVEVVSHKTESGKVGSYDVTIHRIHSYNPGFGMEFEQVVAEHELFEMYLENISLDENDDESEDTIPDKRYDIVELEFR